MNQRVLEKDIQIDGVTYRMKKPDARTSCWLFSYLGAKIETEGGSIFSAIGKCSRAEFADIQNIALANTFRVDFKEDNSFPIPVLAPSGKIVDPGLEDASNLMKITSEYLSFVLQPFIVESGSNSLT